MDGHLVPTSKFLSLVLRHKPETIGLTLDAEGWADLDELIALASRGGRHLTRELIEQVVEQNDKRRFVFSDDRRRIRAQQGHSIEIELNLPPRQPPEILYHGTVAKFLPAVRAQGLIKGSRQHVHLSSDRETARRVGERRGAAVILTIRAELMHGDGFSFFLSGNGVWLTDHVPPQYLSDAP